MEQNALLPVKAMNMNLMNGGASDIPSGNPPLFYQVYGDNTNLPNIVSVVPAIEERVRARYGIAPATELKFAVVSSSGSRMKGLADAMERRLHFNNKDVLQNGANYQRFVYAEAASPPELDHVTSEVAAFKPDLVLMGGYSEAGDTLIPGINKKLADAKAPHAPYFVFNVLALTNGLVNAATATPELQTRLLWLNPVFATQASQLLAMTCESTFSITPALDVRLLGFVEATYDMMYVYTYAIAVNGNKPVTGENVAKALAKIFDRSGRAIQSGDANLFQGFEALKPTGAGKIFLQGTIIYRGPDDGVLLDLATGNVPYRPYQLFRPLSNVVAGTPYPEYPPFAIVSGQSSGVEFTPPDYSGTKGEFSGACDC